MSNVLGVRRGVRQGVIAVLAWCVVVALSFAGPKSFTVEFDPVVQQEKYSGRVYVVVAKGGGQSPRERMGDWFGTPQICAADVRDAGPGAPVTIDDKALQYPGKLAELPPGKYTVQAVARKNLDHFMAGRGEGDLYSEPVEVDWAATGDEPLTLKLSKAVGPAPRRETERLKHFEMTSKLLSDFHGRPVTVRAGVVLPVGWSADAGVTWPAVYFITGFGSDHRSASMFLRGGGRRGEEETPARDRVLWIVPDPTNHWGHSVFADSANTGPWGRMLIEELIPAVEKKFKGPAAEGGGGGARRFVTGVSSGGWSSLWLQITYPDQFAGCWSHVPDPVDFRDFQRIDLYAPGANMYRDADGKQRPLSRGMPGMAALQYERFVAMETVLGPGGQIGSFEAVFSPRGKDGLPRPLFDRATGAVDPVTAKAWEAYDIRLILERRWAELAPKLQGKVHVYAGELDTFYLEGAAKLLKASLEKLDPEGKVAIVEIVPGMPHMMHRPAMAELEKRAAETAPEPARK